MGQGNHIHTHKMSNGVELELREVPGFGDRSEIGFFIDDKCIGTFLVDKMRSGNLIVKPTMMKAMKLTPGKKEPEDVQPEEKPSLDDIADINKDEDDVNTP